MANLPFTFSLQSDRPFDFHLPFDLKRQMRPFDFIARTDASLAMDYVGAPFNVWPRQRSNIADAGTERTSIADAATERMGPPPWRRDLRPRQEADQAAIANATSSATQAVGGRLQRVGGPLAAEQSSLHEDRDPTEPEIALVWNSDCRLSRLTGVVKETGRLPGAHHPRRADLAFTIKLSLQDITWHTILGRARSQTWTEYHATYLGHGQSKTAFSLCCEGERFNDAVLKVARCEEMEPAVFTCAAHYGLCPPVLYNSWGFEDGYDHQWHCWITEKAIPLDEFMKLPDADPQQCALAAFICVLKAAQHGFYVSDTHFFNFGFKLAGFATEHSVVIIDAGSRGWHPERARWAKAVVNRTIMHRFWNHAVEHGADISQIKEVWQRAYECAPCLQWAQNKWDAWPWLTTHDCSDTSLRASCLATEQHEIGQMQQTAAYKLLRLIARRDISATDLPEFQKVCCKAYRDLHITPDEANAEVLQELHSRITSVRTYNGAITHKTFAEQYSVIDFWRRLGVFREQIFRQRLLDAADTELTIPEVAQCLTAWEREFQKYETTEEQKTFSWGRLRSLTNAVFNKRTGWSYAGKAILQLGLPRVSFGDDWDAATERVRAMAIYAEEMVFWLQCFADTVTMHRSTDEYREARQRSGVSKNSSGLTAEQLLARETQANARWYLMRGKKLAYGSKYTHQMSRWERRLFDKYQRGELQAEYTEARLQIERVAPFRFATGQATAVPVASDHAFADMPRRARALIQGRPLQCL